MTRITIALCAVLALGSAHAQHATDGGAITPPAASTASSTTIDIDAPSPACRCVVAGTLVDLEIVDALASSRQVRGDRFKLRVAEPIRIGDTIVVPVGAEAVGEIVHAAAAKGGGKPGELLLAARQITLQDRVLPLRGLKLGVSGKSNAELALAVSFAAGPFAMFIRGREIEIPAGTRVHAKFAQDVPLDATASPLDAPAPSIPTTVSSTQE